MTTFQILKIDPTPTDAADDGNHIVVVKASNLPVGFDFQQFAAALQKSYGDMDITLVKLDKTTVTFKTNYNSWLALEGNTMRFIAFKVTFSLEKERVSVLLSGFNPDTNSLAVSHHLTTTFNIVGSDIKAVSTTSFSLEVDSDAADMLLDCGLVYKGIKITVANLSSLSSLPSAPAPSFLIVTPKPVTVENIQLALLNLFGTELDPSAIRQLTPTTAAVTCTGDIEGFVEIVRDDKYIVRVNAIASKIIPITKDTLTFPVNGSATLATLRSSISNAIPASEILDLEIIPGDVGYLNVKSEASKTLLLTNTIVPPVINQVNNNVQPSSAPQAASPAPEALGRDAKFITLRDQTAYIELAGQDSFNRINEDGYISVSNFELPVAEFTGQIPYNRIYLSPIPRDLSQVATSLAQLTKSPISRIGRIESCDNSYLAVLLSSANDLAKLLQMNLVHIKPSPNDMVSVVGDEKPEFCWVTDRPPTSKVSSREIPIKASQKTYLESRCREMLDRMRDNMVLCSLDDDMFDQRKKVARLMSPNESNLKAASDSFTRFLSEVSERHISIPFTALSRATVFMNRLPNEAEKFKYVMVTCDKDAYHRVSVTLCGDRKDVDSLYLVVQAIQVESLSLTAEEKRNVILDIREVYSRHNVNLVEDIDCVLICGVAKDVESFKSWLLPQLNRQSKESIPCKKGQKSWIDRCLAKDLQNVTITTAGDNIELFGSTDHVKSAKKKIQEFLVHIETKKTTKKFTSVAAKGLTSFLSQHLKDCSVCFDQTASEEDFNGDVFVEISFWTHSTNTSKADIAKIDSVLRMREGSPKTIEMTAQELESVSRIIRANPNIVLGSGHLVVHGLWDNTVTNLVDAIDRAKQESEASLTFNIGEQEFQYFVGMKMNAKFSTLFPSLELKLKIGRSTIVCSGPRKDTEAFRQAVKKMCDGLALNLFPLGAYRFLIKHFEPEFQSIIDSLSAKHNVHFLRKVDNVEVIGADDLNWDSIRKDYDSRSPVASNWPKANDHASLAMELPHLGTFKDDNQLLEFHRRPSSYGWDLVARCQAHIDAAIAALEDLTANHTKSIRVLVPPCLLSLALASRPDGCIKRLVTQRVDIVVERDNTIRLSGHTKDVDKTYAELQKTLEKMAKEFVKTNIQLPASIVAEVLKSDFINSFIKEHSSLISESGVKATQRPTVVQITDNTFRVGGGIGGTMVEIISGDLLKEPTDCIVSSSNETLSPTGGLAGIIAKAAGTAMTNECHHYVQTKGKVKEGEAVITGAGKLPFKAIVHVVVATWESSKRVKQEADIQSTLTSALSLAPTENCRSISISGIGSGACNIPKDISARNIVAAIVQFVATSPMLYTKIRLCDMDQATLNCFIQEMKRHVTVVRPPMPVTPVRTVPVPAASMPRSHFEVAFQWSWRENDGTFIEFDSDQNYQLEIGYLQAKQTLVVTGDRNMIKNNYHYKIDFAKMTETNTQFNNNPRPITRVPKKNIASNPDYVNSFKLFESERLIKEEQQGFTGMAQNDAPEDDYFDYSTADLSLKTILVISSDFKYSTQAKLALERYSKGQQETRQTPMTKTHFTALESKIKSVAQDKGCTFQHSHERLLITGQKAGVSAAMEQVVAILFKHMQDNPDRSDNLVYPWASAATQMTNLEIVNLSTTNKEYLDVMALIKKTSPNTVVEKIERINNKWLWEAYSVSRKMLSKKLLYNIPADGSMIPLKERMLFHGTRAVDPKTIYNGEVGFDTRHAAAGMWGRATYFAENFSYSHTYLYTAGQSGQMFLSRVLIGEPTPLTAAGQYIKPPAKGTTAGKQGYIEDYDSIFGSTGGSDVYMIYANNRAYPEYLITFKP
eukprot:gene15680-18634_t